MLNRAKATLKSLLTYKVPSASGIRYSFAPTAGFINVDNLLNGKPYWSETSGEQYKSKRLIITDCSYALDVIDAKDDPFWQFLLKEDVELYVWTGELVKVTNVVSLTTALNKVELIDNLSLEKKLATLEFQKGSYEILDYLRVKELHADLSPLIIKTIPSKNSLLHLGNLNGRETLLKVLNNMPEEKSKTMAYTEDVEILKYADELILSSSSLAKLINMAKTDAKVAATLDNLKFLDLFLGPNDNVETALFISLCPSLKSVSICNDPDANDAVELDPKIIQALIQSPKIESLTLKDIGIDVDKCNKILSSNKYIKKIKLIDCKLQNFNNVLTIPLLTEFACIELHGFPNYNIILKGLAQQSALEKVELDLSEDSWNITQIPNWSQLKSLELSNLSPSSMNEQLLYQILSRCGKNLLYLSLHYGQDDEVNSVNLSESQNPPFPVLSNLQELSLSLGPNVEAINSQVLMKLLRSCENLEKLYLSCNNLQLDSLDELLKFEQLTYLNITCQSNSLLKFLKMCPNLKTLILNSEVDDLPENIDLHLNSLTELCVKERRIDAKLLGILLNSAPNLKSCTVECVTGDLILKRKLNFLIDLEINTLGDAQLKALLSSSPNLESIKVEINANNIKLLNSLSSTNIKHIIPSLTAYKQNALGNIKITDLTLIELLNNKLLILNNVTVDYESRNITGEFLTYKYNSLPHLKKLFIQKALLVDIHYLGQFLSSAPNLVVLKGQLDFLDSIQNPLTIRKKSNLKKITLYSSNITDIQLEFLLSNCPKLVSLKLIGCENITGSFKLPKSLERLKIEQTEIDIEKLVALISQAKNLKYLSCTLDDRQYDAIQKIFPDLLINRISDKPNRPDQPAPSGLSKIDTVTNGNPTLPVRIFYKKKANGFPVPNNFRIEISDYLSTLDKVEYLQIPIIPENAVAHYSNDPFKLHEEYQREHEKSSDVFYGQVTLPTGLNDWYPLPSLTSHDKILSFAANTDVPLQLGYCIQKSLYYVKPSAALNKPLTVSFLNNANIFNYDFKLLSIQTKLPFKRLSFGANGRLNQNAETESIIKKFNSLSLQEKISQLAAFTSNFKVKTIPSEYANDIKKLNALISNEAGVCRHRSMVFVALAQELGINARAIENDCHAFVEVMFENNWMKLELGGGSATLVPVPMVLPTKNTPALAPKISEIKPTAETATIALPTPTVTLSADNPFITWSSVKSNAVSYAEYSQDILKASASLPPAKKNTLIILDNEQIEPLQSQLTQTINANSSTSIYLHNLDDITEKQAIVNITGGLETPPSSLMSFVQNAKPGDMLISNWSDYKAGFVGYNSMMDEDRKLKGAGLSRDLGVVAFLDKANANVLGEDFYSRFRLTCECPSLPIPENVQQILSKPSVNPKFPANYETAQFFNEDWEGVLLGRININGQMFNIDKGILSNDIKNSSGLILENAPWENVQFRIFINELLQKKSFRVNGETISLPANFEIIAQSKPLELHSPYVHTIQELPRRPRPFILNSQTLKHFIKNHQCENGLLFTKLGWIANNKILNICVTETLPESSWAQLIQLANKHKCELNLILAPNVRLPDQMNVNTNSIVHMCKPTDSVTLITTNDLEMAEEELFNKNPSALVVSINAETKFADLIAKPKVTNLLSTTQKKVDVLHFELDVGTVWDKVMKGEDVILKGNLSPILAKELESLFLGHLWVNDKLEIPKGKLIIITDTKNTSNLVKAHHLQYEEKDYLEKLDAMFGEKPGYSHFKHQLQKFQQANPAINFEYGQLRAMAQKIAQGSTANPFKPYFRLDNDKGMLATAKNFWLKNMEQKSPNVLVRRHIKIMKELSYSDYLFIAGESGVGKSTFIQEELKKWNCKVFVGVDQLMEWLTCSNNQNQYIVLFIDEANLERDGTWDKLEGAFNKTRGLLPEGKFYPLTKKHKVIFGGNYNNFVARQKHRFIQRHGQVINFKEFPDDVLLNTIIFPAMLSAFPDITKNIQDEMSQKILDLYRYINTEFPKHLLTPRNLKMIFLRTKYYYENLDLINQDILMAMKLGVYDEVNGLLNADQLAVIKTKLKLNDKLIAQVTDDQLSEIDPGKFIVTESRKPVICLLHSQLVLRESLLNNPSLSRFHLPGFLLEGGAGIGKSRMMVEELQGFGFSSDNPDTTKRYYHITPTDPAKMTEILLKAFHEGAIVIIDEINALPLERLLNQLMSGYDMEGNPAKKKGFYVIATQNPITFSGRQVLSGPFENRFKKMILSDYPEPELRSIAFEIYPDAKVSNHAVDMYLNAKNYAIAHNKIPAPTPRNLFEYLAMKLKPTDTVMLEQEVRAPAPSIYRKSDEEMPQVLTQSSSLSVSEKRHGSIFHKAKLSTKKPKVSDEDKLISPKMK